jgi:hypothetical protein
MLQTLLILLTPSLARRNADLGRLSEVHLPLRRRRRVDPHGPHAGLTGIAIRMGEVRGKVKGILREAGLLVLIVNSNWPSSMNATLPPPCTAGWHWCDRQGSMTRRKPSSRRPSTEDTKVSEHLHFRLPWRGQWSSAARSHNGRRVRRVTTRQGRNARFSALLCRCSVLRDGICTFVLDLREHTFQTACALSHILEPYVVDEVGVF